MRMPRQELRRNDFFVVNTTEDPDVREYHSRVRLLDDWMTQGAMKGAKFISPGEPTCAVLDLALDVPGVAGANVKAYLLTVEKSPVFSWDEIEENLMQMFYGIKTALVLPER